jgi:4-hydroxybenzoate polyprenyltransferase
VHDTSPLRLFASISRFHIVAIATLSCFTFGWIFTGSYPWLIAAICGLDWFLVNILNRVVDLGEDKKNAVVGTNFVERHQRVVLRVGLGTLITSLVAVALIEPALLIPRLAYHSLGLAYNWPIFPGGRRIKQLYFWKNTASAMGFILTLFVYPMVVTWHGDLDFAPGMSWAAVAITALFFFLFELSYEVIYDLRDAPGDAAEGVRTYPVVHGQRGAVRIIDALIGAFLAVMIAGYAAGLLPWALFVMILAPVLQLVLYKPALRRGITSQDCVRLTWLGAILMLAYHGWYLLDLPGTSL